MLTLASQSVMLTLASQSLLLCSAKVTTMVFQRIKTVKGHQYRYEVENVRENGKVKQKILKYFGRADKERPVPPTIVSGLFYFAKNSCTYCSTEKDVKEYIERFSQKAGIQVPPLQYINVSTMKNPTNIDFEGVPHFIANENGKIYIRGGNGAERSWLRHKLGEKKYYEIEEELKHEDIKEHLNNGKTYQELRSMGYRKEDIRICQGKPPQTKKELLKQQQEIEKIRQRIQQEELKCTNGVCQISQ